MIITVSVCVRFQMVAVFLMHFTPGGAELLTEIPADGTYYLPNAHNDELELSSELDEEHSALCLGLL